MRERRHIVVRGIVQGVGFRPFVYVLAQQYQLGGHVNNDASGVTIEIEGESAALECFYCALQNQAPPLARIESVQWQTQTPLNETKFVIQASHNGARKQTFISPDVCVCDDCLREMNDRNDRRFAYPFINCTNCGPRFTIIQDVPYDRPATTMAPFVMCDECQREYDDPTNRRFHAQPNACPVCGPQVRLEVGAEVIHGAAAIEQTAQLLRAGKIVAIKGLGGYHLAGDATNEQAVKNLRTRKHRFEKPFALMVSDVEAARELCEVSEMEAQVLAGRQRPIVLLQVLAARRVAAQVAPKENHLGIMLPYAPLHFLLFQALQVLAGQNAILVMTSGNLSDEPIAFHDDEARARLISIADAFLTHDREIYMRCDDSVTRVLGGAQVLARRSRGYAPAPVRAPFQFAQPILATGAHLKNTFCLAKNEHAFVSHHIGDLENVETLKSFSEGIEHFKCLFDVQPKIVAYDLHPEYLATKYALNLELPTLGVQHHHAHIAAVTGENNIGETVIGVAFDGTGYGTDGTLWGGEFLLADWCDFERAAHWQTLPLIGGEAAIHQVWRLAAAWLYETFGTGFLDLDIDFVRNLDRKTWRVLQQMLAKNFNAPRSSSVGRYFDAVAALLGVRDIANYEAQAAIELEILADKNCRDEYPFALTETVPQVLAADKTLRAIVDDLQNDVSSAMIAAKWHNTVAASTCRTCEAIRDARDLNCVALGGGVWQNALLLERTLERLRARGFEVMLPKELPFNDGAISFGQAVVAGARLSKIVV